MVLLGGMRFRLFCYTLLTLSVLDTVWLLMIAFSFYKDQLLHLLAPAETVWAVLILYPLYAFGVTYFAVLPALLASSLSTALKRGALFGLVVYGYYNLTNQAMLIDWPPIYTLVDIGWGVLITAVASVVAFVLGRKGEWYGEGNKA